MTDNTHASEVASHLDANLDTDSDETTAAGQSSASPASSPEWPESWPSVADPVFLSTNRLQEASSRLRELDLHQRSALRRTALAAIEDSPQRRHWVTLAFAVNAILTAHNDVSPSGGAGPLAKGAPIRTRLEYLTIASTAQTQVLQDIGFEPPLLLPEALHTLAWRLPDAPSVPVILDALARFFDADLERERQLAPATQARAEASELELRSYVAGFPFTDELMLTRNELRAINDALRAWLESLENCSDCDRRQQGEAEELVRDLAAMESMIERFVEAEC